MYITLRKYRAKRDFAAVREAVQTGLLPILKACPGFRGHWLLNCSDGACAGLSIFDTEAEANAALQKTVTWVHGHINNLLVLPPEAMFGAAMAEFAAHEPTPPLHKDG